MNKVYLVGAGPGAPDLLTLRAARLLEKANIVFYDALVHADTVALAVNAKKVAVGKRVGGCPPISDSSTAAWLKPRRNMPSWCD